MQQQKAGLPDQPMIPPKHGLAPAASGSIAGVLDPAAVALPVRSSIGHGTVPRLDQRPAVCQLPIGFVRLLIRLLIPVGEQLDSTSAALRASEAS